MESVIQYIHNSISVIFLSSTLFVLVRSYIGWKKVHNWYKRDYYFALTVVLTMYMQLILGLYLFFDARYFQSGTSLEKPTDLRFWPIEHFFIMIFALLTAQMGFIIASNTKKAQNKHRTLFVYDSIALSLVFVSLTMIFLE